jgi:quinol monooxygenase YgiN
MRTMFGAALAALLFFLVPAGTAAQSPAPSGPVYVVTHIDFTPRNAAAGEKALLQYALDSRKEAGAVRCEVLQEAAAANHFIVLEIWRDRPAYDAHLAAADTLRFRDAIQPLIGAPFDTRLARLDQ